MRLREEDIEAWHAAEYGVRRVLGDEAAVRGREVGDGARTKAVVAAEAPATMRRRRR